MLLNLVGPFFVNRPFGTEIAFSKGLQALGIDVNEVDPNLTGQTFEKDADFTVVFKTAMRYNHLLATMKGPVVVYQPDDLYYQHIKDMMLEMSKWSPHALVFQKSGVDFCLSSGFRTAGTLMLTADPYLYRPLMLEKMIDFCFVGSLGEHYAHRSRRKMIDLLIGHGFNVHYESTNDVHRINWLYNRSKVVLNHAADVGHGFGVGSGYQCRHFEAGFAGACLLSNSLVEQEDTTIHMFETFSDEEELLEKADALLRDSERREQKAELLYTEMMAAHHPVIRAAQLIEYLKGVQ